MSISSSDIASTLVDGAVDNGGSTVWLSIPLEAGYLVGIPAHALTFESLDAVVEADVIDWAASLVDQRALLAIATLGSWVDPETGEVSFDACDWHADAALNIGRARGEIAVWDIAASASITVESVA